MITPHYDKTEVEVKSRGRGREILTHFGLSPEALDGKHGECPHCGGKDRFRAIDPDNGVLYCNQCFYEKNGDLPAAVQWMLGCSFSEAVNKIGEYLNATPAAKRKQAAPKKPPTPFNDQIRFLDPDPAKFAEWADHKSPVSVEAMQDAGVRLVSWPAKALVKYQQECVAIPAYRTSDDPSGWILYRVDGQPFPAMKDGPGERKTHLLRGSNDGWVYLGGRSAVEAAHTIIKCEGAADMFSIAPYLPEGVIAVTNTHGAKSAKNCPIDIFTGKRVIVIGDTDKSGVDGAYSLAGEVLPYADEVKVIFPYGEITESNGRDIRDEMNDNQQAGIDYQETVDRFIQQAAEAPVFRLPQDEPQQDDTSDHSEDDDQEEYQPFPVDCLPAPMRDYVKAGRESLKCDLSFIAGPLLVVIASLIGASRVLRITDEWRVPAILWLVTIADSGSMKTPTQSLATKPLYKLQARAHAQNRETLETYKLNMEIYEARRKEYIKELAKADGPPPDEPIRPDDPKIINKVAGDVTIEAVAPMMKNNPKCVTIVNDELSKMIGNLNKYSGAKGSDEAVLLEGYNLGTMQVARKHDPVDIFVPNAAICILGNTQPQIYRRMMNTSYRESGFMSRFLKIYPRKTMKQFPGKGIPEDVKEALMNLVESLDLFQPMEKEEGEYEPIPVYMTNEAHQAYRAFHQYHNEEAVSLSGDLAAEWSKLEEIPARLALIFHCVECVASGGVDEKVSLETMQKAIELTDWFKSESLRVYRLFDSEGDTGSSHNKAEQRLVRFIRDQGGSVSVRDTQRRMSFKTADDTERALGELVKKGVAEWVNIPTKKRGRPARGISLRHSDTLTQSENPLDSGDCVFTKPQDSDSRPISEPQMIPEQYEDTAPDDLGEFMDFMDD
ncbi:DUF3987 domain-containing protein [Gimesia algae]|uniref:Zinc-binding domain of primase-helicase n=1 Tax=Gimesia algae TaxID=2527971 RepID=A0A517V828_9PLAN|nr:DUF3987 domain-containing protein [Gimesia algae]QDT89153.1 Zinc-binding domain of primase-helicase [Gimesia algae]